VALGQTVLTYGGFQQFWGRWRARPWDGAVADPLKHTTLQLVLPCQIRSFSVKPYERNY